MIVIAGTVDLKPEARDAALETTRELMAQTRTQRGCLDYVWAPDSAVPGRIYVFERWETTEDLAAHFAGPHYLAMRDTVAAHGIRGVGVSKYAIERSEPVYDPTGTPRADFFTKDG